MKEIRKVMEESEYFENTTISFQLIAIKCLIQLLDPSSSVDVKNDLKQMLFSHDFSNDKILSSPSVNSSQNCIDIMTHRLKVYTGLLHKDYQEWKTKVESQKKNLPFDMNKEYLENTSSCLKLFELLNKENELELALPVKSKISTNVIQLLSDFVTIVYNDHQDMEECYHQFLLNSIKVLINFFNEAKEAEQYAKAHPKGASSPPNILTEDQYQELFKVLSVFINQFSPLSEDNRQTKLQDIFLLIIGLLINATEHNEQCRIILAQQQLGKSCTYQPNAKKNTWNPCRFGCVCPESEKRGFLEMIVEIYSSIIKTENYILASYLAILIGFLCLHPENKVVVKQYLFENSFSTIIQILEQFLQLNTLSREFDSPSLGFNPNALINAGGSTRTSTSSAMLDFTSSFPSGDPDAALDIGLLNGLSMPSPLTTTKNDHRQDQDTTTESFLKVIEVLKQS